MNFKARKVTPEQWKSVDFTRPVPDIAKELGLTPTTVDNLTKDEKSLLLYAETICVDNQGVYDPKCLNATDNDILDKWQIDGFCEHGRVASEYLTDKRCVWLQLSDDALKLAHAIRSRKAKRVWNNRKWLTTKEKQNSD